MRTTLVVGWVVFSCLVQVVGAQEIDDFQFFPVVARTMGAGVPPTRWVTDLTIHNPADSRLVVGAQFYPAGQPNVFDPEFPVQFILEPRETRTFEDVLAELFGYDTDVKGALLVQSDPSMFPANPDDARIVATTRTYNVGDPEGTYGQTVPWTWRIANVFGTPSYITGARNDRRYRSNLGIVNLSLEPVTVHYRILGASGSVLVEDSRELPMGFGDQWSFRELGVGRVDGPLTVELWLDAADVPADPCDEEPLPPNRFVAYVSKVDGNPSGTGDAEFLYAAPTDVDPCPHR
jgi:hypothetical protein